MPPSSPIAYRPEIDGLRAIAIASVVLFHAGSSWFPGGYVGVDVFFVISGYLITSIIVKEQAEGRFSYWRFYARRARRILPALFFMLTVVTALCSAILLPDGLIEYGKLLIYTIIFGANVRLAAEPGYFDTGSQENPLLHIWSLSVEEQFYLIWPALFLAMSLWLSVKRCRYAICALTFVSFVCAVILLDVWPKSAFYHLPSRGWELSCGAVLAIGILPEIRSRVSAQGLSALGLLLIIAPAFLCDDETPFPGFAALPPVIGSVLIIYCTTTFKTVAGTFLSVRPLVYLGLVSYSLYLWHWPILALPSYLLMGDVTPLQKVCCIAAAVVMAGVSYRFVETPFRRGGHDLALKRGRYGADFRLRAIPTSVSASFAIAVILIAFGSFFQESKGASWRFPAEILVANPADQDNDYLSCAKQIELQKSFTFCQMGERGSLNHDASVILWGDSHAMHYERLIATIYKQGAAYLHDGCVPVLNTYLVYGKIETASKTCFAKKEEAFRKILNAKPKIVIIAGRWTYSEPFPYGHEYHHTLAFIKRAGDPLDLDHSRSVFGSELYNTVSRLTQAGIKVVLMGQAPEMLYHLQHCMALGRSFATDTSRCTSITRAEVERRQANVNRVLASIEAGNPNVKVFWPIPSMCDAERCYAVRDGKILYRDNNHLSAAGAASLIGAYRTSMPAEFLPAGAGATSSSAILSGSLTW